MPKSDQYLRINKDEIFTNKNHFYFVLAAIIEANRNIYSPHESYFTIQQIYEFLHLKLRKDYSAYRQILSAYQYMIDSVQILVPSDQNYPEPDLNTCFRLTILPGFYGSSFSKLSYEKYVTLRRINSPVSKEKLFHVYLYMNLYPNFYASLNTTAQSTLLSKTTASLALNYITANYLF